MDGVQHTKESKLLMLLSMPAEGNGGVRSSTWLVQGVPCANILQHP